jgi:hypothetical protein
MEQTMLLQTNSYVVPNDKRDEHARLMRRFRETLARIGCDDFEAYEQVGMNWNGRANGRFVQIMRFKDRKQYQAVQAAERNDSVAQDLIREFCELVDFEQQQEQGIFAVGFYISGLSTAPVRVRKPGQSGLDEIEGQTVEDSGGEEDDTPGVAMGGAFEPPQLSAGAAPEPEAAPSKPMRPFFPPLPPEGKPKDEPQ